VYYKNITFLLQKYYKNIQHILNWGDWKMKIKTWQVITAIICIILGILLHFAYEWTGENIIVGIFSAVNESTWEHLKLIFYPMLLMAIIGSFIIGRKSYNYWFAQTLGILTAILFTMIFFYTYTGVIGANYDWLNIATFVVAVLLGAFVTYKVLTSRKIYDAEVVSILFLIILLFSFMLYTFNPPQIQLFEAPATGRCGI